jgi:hypothetical protein
VTVAAVPPPTQLGATTVSLLVGAGECWGSGWWRWRSVVAVVGGCSWGGEVHCRHTARCWRPSLPVRPWPVCLACLLWVTGAFGASARRAAGHMARALCWRPSLPVRPWAVCCFGFQAKPAAIDALKPTGVYLQSIKARAGRGGAATARLTSDPATPPWSPPAGLAGPAAAAPARGTCAPPASSGRRARCA